MSDVGRTDERNSAIRKREDGRTQRKKGKKGSHCADFSDHSATHGYLGYPGSGAWGRRGRTLVLAPPCGGRPRTLILHHPPHRLLPPDLLTPQIQADLGGSAHRVAVGRGAAVKAWSHGFSVGQSLAARTGYTDIGDGYAPHCSITFYTRLLGLWLEEYGGVARQHVTKRTYINTNRWDRKTRVMHTYMKHRKTAVMTTVTQHKQR